MSNELENFKEYLRVFQTAYLIADEKKTAQILVQVIAELQNVSLNLSDLSKQTILIQTFTELLNAMERNDYVHINDILEFKIVPLLEGNMDSKDGIVLR